MLFYSKNNIQTLNSYILLYCIYIMFKKLKKLKQSPTEGDEGDFKQTPDEIEREFQALRKSRRRKKEKNSNR